MSDQYQKLITWLSQYPKTFISDKLTTHRTESTGNSIFAASNIPKNEKIINIPPQLNLNFVTVLHHLQLYTQLSDEETRLRASDPYVHFYSQLTYTELLSLSSFQLISLYLVLESQRDESFWKPFLDVLPHLNEFECVPFTWIIKENSNYFDQLPLSVRSHSLKQLKNFKKDFEVIQELLNGKKTSLIVSKPDFLRFWLCCNSRCLYMKLPKDLEKTEEDNFTMVPLVDFLNHKLDEGCRVNITLEGFQVFSETNYDAGDQVYLSYGAHSNEFLLCEYGFMFNRDTENKWNSIDITDSILSKLQKNPEKVKFLKEIGYLGDYHIGADVSYRIEVALLVFQEDDDTFVANSPPRRLTNFIQGLTNGEIYSNVTTKLLEEILTKILDDCQPYLTLTINNYKDGILQRLYQDIYDIASSHLNPNI